MPFLWSHNPKFGHGNSACVLKSTKFSTGVWQSIISKLGAGGMGEVYLAQDAKLDRRVALKVLPSEVAANQDRMRRFVQEAKAAVGR